MFCLKKTAELLQTQGCLEHSWEGLDRSNQKALIYITTRRQEKQRETAFGKCEECHRWHCRKSTNILVNNWKPWYWQKLRWIIHWKMLFISVWKEIKIKIPIFCDANGDVNKCTTKYLTGRRRNHKKEKSADWKYKGSACVLLTLKTKES